MVMVMMVIMMMMMIMVMMMMMMMMMMVMMAMMAMMAMMMMVVMMAMIMMMVVVMMMMVVVVVVMMMVIMMVMMIMMMHNPNFLFPSPLRSQVFPVALSLALGSLHKLRDIQVCYAPLTLPLHAEAFLRRGYVLGGRQLLLLVFVP